MEDTKALDDFEKEFGVHDDVGDENFKLLKKKFRQKKFKMRGCYITGQYPGEILAVPEL